MAVEGDVGTFPLGDLLAWLAGRRATGVLSLTRGMTARRFHLRGGQIHLVSSSEQEMLLGHLLVESNLLGREALAAALAGRGRSRARLGRLLTEGGLVTPAELQKILTEKVHRLLADALTWDDGRFFYEAHLDVDAGVDVSADVGVGVGAGASVRPAARPVRRRARREDKRAIAVAVDLQAALDRIRSQAEGPPAPAADHCVVIDDSDVVDDSPAARADPPSV